MSSPGKSDLTFSSPKRAPRGELWDGLFPYYAGFSERFAVEALRQLSSSDQPVVWDPFNGSGTTTFAAQSLGLQSVGNDINPVMVIAARARAFPNTELSSLRPIAAEVARNALGTEIQFDDDDPLTAWFSEHEVHAARSILKSTIEVTAESSNPFEDSTGKILWSCLTAILITCLFSTLRREIAPNKGSNPTWIPKSIHRQESVSISREELVQRYEDSVSRAYDFLINYSQNDDSVVPHIVMGSSEVIGPINPRPNFIFTSPPYLTRIDYTVTTRVELALLNRLSSCSETDLRERMMGSTISPKSCVVHDTSWGRCCTDTLERILNHKSKASSSYYYRTFVDYFSKLSSSLNNVTKNVESKSKALIVVQDSHYKEVHVDLQRIVRDMMKNDGFECIAQEDFLSKNSMAYANPKSNYRVSGKIPTESVMVFERA